MVKKDADLLETDEFLVALRRGYKYVLENIRFVSMIAGGILAGLLIILLVLYQAKASRDKQSVALSEAVAAYHEGRHDDALAALKPFSGKSDLHAARAELYEGNILFDQGKYEEALPHFDRVRKLAAEKKIDVLQGLALQGMAFSERELGRPDRAEELLERLRAILPDVALLDLARLHAAQGDNEKARGVLEELIREHADSPLATTAETLKKNLGP